MFAFMPPTRAALSTTFSGRSDAKNAATAFWSRRSSSCLERSKRFVYPSACILATIAEPTSPWCPATYILESFSNFFLFTQ